MVATIALVLSIIAVLGLFVVIPSMIMSVTKFILFCMIIAVVLYWVIKRFILKRG